MFKFFKSLFGKKENEETKKPEHVCEFEIIENDYDKNYDTMIGLEIEGKMVLSNLQSVDIYGKRKYAYQIDKSDHIVYFDGKYELKCKEFEYYVNGDYVYLNKEGEYCIVRNGNEFFRGKDVFNFLNGDYSYRDENNVCNLIRNGEILASGVITGSYIDGSYSYGVGSLGEKEFFFDKEGKPIEKSQINNTLPLPDNESLTDIFAVIYDANKNVLFRSKYGIMNINEREKRFYEKDNIFTINNCIKSLDGKKIYTSRSGGCRFGIE